MKYILIAGIILAGFIGGVAYLDVTKTDVHQFNRVENSLPGVGTIAWELRGFVSETKPGLFLNRAAKNAPYRLTNLVKLRGADWVDAEVIAFTGKNSENTVVMTEQSFLYPKETLSGELDRRAIFDARGIQVDDQLRFEGVLRSCKHTKECTDFAFQGVFKHSMKVEYSSARFPSLFK